MSTEHFQALRQQARNHLDNDEFERAKALLEQIPKDHRLPRDGAAIARCIAGVGRIDEAIDLLTAIIDRAPANQPALKTLIDVALSHGRTAIVLETCSALQRRMPDASQATIMVARGLQAREAHSHTITVLEQYRELSRTDHEINFLLAQAYERSGDRGSAHDVLIDDITANSDRMAVYEDALRFALRTTNKKLATEIIEAAERRTTPSYLFHTMVRFSRCQETNDFNKAGEIVDDACRQPMDCDTALKLARFFFANPLLGDPYIVRFLEVCRNKFPTNAQLASLSARARITHAYKTKSLSDFEREKKEILKESSKSERLKILAHLHLSNLNLDECSEVINHKVRISASPESLISIFALLSATKGGAELREVLQKLPPPATQEEEMVRLLILWKSDVSELVQQCSLRRVDWNEFKTLSTGTKQKIDAKLASLPLDNRGHPGRIGLRKFHDWALRLEQQARAVYLDTEPSYYHATLIAAEIRHARKTAQPLSLLRIGDGEGRYLTYAKEHAHLQTEDRVVIETTWWGRPTLTEMENDRLSCDLHNAIQDADIIGVPPLIRIISSNSRHANKDARALDAIINSIENFDLEGKLITSAHISSDLEEWKLYADILTTPGPISTISCHELSAALARRFGIAVRQTILIPPEHAHAAKFEYDARAERLYPDCFERIVRGLDVEPGEIFLIGAGIIGKLLCREIKARGGIAIDIGAVADFWMGHQTRRWGKDLEIIDPKSTLLTNFPISDDFKKQTNETTSPCRTDEMRRQNIEPRFGSLMAAEDARLEVAIMDGEYPLLITGHPRCASGYISNYLVQCGIDIGHKNLMQYGTCSWLHAVQDYAMPFINWKPGPSLVFKHRLAFVRDPADALPSIILENTQANSWLFRRYHIFHQRGVDISGYKTSLARAAASYLHWMDIVDDLSPIGTIRAEHAAQDIDRLIRPLYPNMRPPASEQSVEDGKQINNSNLKFSIPKPELRHEDYNALPAELIDGLMAFCARHDYDSDRMFGPRPFPGNDSKSIEAC